MFFRRISRSGLTVDADGVPGSPEQTIRTRRKRLAWNFVAVMSGQALGWLASAPLVVLLPRFLGDENLGKLTFAFALTTLFMTVVLFGSNVYLARAVAREPHRAAHLTYNTIVSRAPLIVVSVVLMVGFLYLFDYPHSTRTVVYVAMGTMVLSSIQQTVGAAFQGLERMTLMSFTGIIEKVLVLVLGVGALAFADQGLLCYVALLVVGAAITTCIQLAWFIRTVGLSMRIDRALARRLFLGGAPFFIWSVSYIIYGTIDITLLSLLADDKVVGWYGLAYRIVGIPAFIAFAVTTALLPALSSAKGEEFQAVASRCMDLAVIMIVPIALFLLVGASSLIDFLDYPEGFDHSIVLIRILSLHVPLVAVSMVAGTVLIALDRELARTRMAIAAAVLNPLANLIAIPFFAAISDNAAIGTAIVTVCTEACIVTASLIFVGRGVFTSANVATGVRCLGAGAVMSIAMITAIPYGLIAVMAIGGATYPLAALLFRAVSIRDLRDAGALLRPRRTQAEAAI
jgi:O-antigen/teichoic acid export membrane protein